MSDIVYMICGGGVGDCLLTLQTQYCIQRQNKYAMIYVCCRDEVFEPLQFLADGINKLEQLDENLFDVFLRDDTLLGQKIDLNNSEVYLQIPDLLYRHKRSFPYLKYNTTPQQIRENKILLNKWKPEKIIYLGLLSNTLGYSYYDIGGLAVEIAKLLPEFTIYLPILTKWANKTIPNIKTPSNLPKNIYIDNNPNFIDNIKVLYKSYYVVCADNAMAHISYNLGCRRLVLDSRFPCNKNSSPWFARWAENINDHINIENFPKDIAHLIKTNIEIEQTNLLPKNYVLRNMMVYNSESKTDWSKELLFKY